MTDYISREAAIKRMKELHFNCKDFHLCGGVLLELNALDAIPAADVRPVIMCKDCDNWNEWDSSGRKSLGNFRCSCAYWSVEDGPVFYTAPTDFCSYAEKREVEA